MLAWIDEASWIAASLDYPHCKFVTVAMHTVQFRHGVRDGTILGISCTCEKEGTTSVSYQVSVVDERAGPELIFSTLITFVSVNDEGHKRPIRG